MPVSGLAGPTEEVVRSAYLHELRKFYQRKAGTKPVSPAYVENKTKSLSKTDSTGQNFWQKLVSYCIAGGFDYIRLIKAFFAYQADQNDFLLLRHDNIFSRYVVSKYNDSKPSIENCKESLKSQKKSLLMHVDKESLVSGISEKESSEAALSATTSPYCALFRYCALTKLGLPASAWRFDAARQYMLDQKTYDSTWGDFIPQDLKSLSTVKGAVA